MKKMRVNLTVNPHAYRIVQDYLRNAGLGMSGWFNTLIEEYACSIEGEPGFFGKHPSEMTLSEFGKAFSYWVRKLEE